MSQQEIVFSGSPLGGGEMLAEIVNILLALASNRKGNARPVDVQVGEFWIDDALDPTWTVKLWTGSVDLVLFNINLTSETAVVPLIAGGTGAATVAGAQANLQLVKGTSEGNIVALLAGGKLPVVDGSNLTNVLTQTLTTRGDVLTVNSSNELVRLAATAKALLYWDANKDLQLMTGTEGQVVTFDASGLPVVGDPASGGMWEYVGKVEADTDATVEFTGLVDEYDYRVDLSDVVSDYQDKQLQLALGTGATPTWQTSADYFGADVALRSDTGTAGAQTFGNALNYIPLTSTETLYADALASEGQVFLRQSGVLYPRVRGDLTTSYRDGTRMWRMLPFGVFKTVAEITGMQFSFNAGNIAAGTFELFRRLKN